MKVYKNPQYNLNRYSYLSAEEAGTRDLVSIDNDMLHPQVTTSLDDHILKSLRVWLQCYYSPIASHRTYIKSLNV